MPMRKEKKQFENSPVVWFGEETVENRDSALGIAMDMSVLTKRREITYLEDVFEVPRCQLLHF